MRVLAAFLFFLCPLLSWAQPQTYPSSFTVAQDGTGNFKTIQEAINAVRDLSQQQVRILVRKGVYHEKLRIPSWKTNISLVGESRDSTIITNDDYSGKPYPGGKDPFGKDKHSTFSSYTLLVEANDFRAENLTIQNTAGRVGQAVALHIEGDRAVVVNCRLLGNQDTLYTATSESRQYYLQCYIEGTTDFIFGEATAVFQDCIIKSKSNSYITAASTRPGQAYGYVFLHCSLLADTSAKKVYLGRPWRPYAQTVFIQTYMDTHIVKEGWENWRNPENEKTVLYAEYGSYGPGSNTGKRVRWSKQFRQKDLKRYTLEKIFSRKDGWLPQVSVQNSASATLP